jgi:hypothetical protein
VKYSTQFFAWNIELLWLLRAYGQINGIEFFSQHRQRDIATNSSSTSDGYAAPAQEIKAPLHDVLLKLKRRNPVHEKSASTALRLKDRDGVAQLCQFIRASHSAGAAANDGDLPSVRRSYPCVKRLMRKRVFVDELFYCAD